MQTYVVGDTRTGMILEDSAREFGLRNENILNLNATAGNKIVLTNSTLNNVATVNINPNTTDSNTAKMYNMATSSVEEITTRTTGTVDFDSIVKNDGDIKTFAGVINFNGHVNGLG